MPEIREEYRNIPPFQFPSLRGQPIIRHKTETNVGHYTQYGKILHQIFEMCLGLPLSQTRGPAE